jgi:hypothetical protein
MGRPAIDKTDFPLVARVFTVLAAVFLVAAIALATMLPPDMTLHEAMHAIDAGRADDLQRGLIGMFGKGIWTWLIAPLLLRPVWLAPLSLGLICVGGALTASFHAPPRTKHRQS